MKSAQSVLGLAAVMFCVSACVQTGWTQASTPAVSSSPSPTAQLPDDPSVSQRNAAAQADGEGRQTKRILGFIPNFRSVSVDARLPPLSPAEKFKLMAQDSFDYSTFIYVGVLAGVAQAQGSVPEFHQGAAGYGRYYWHSFADNLDGNLMTEAVLPTLTHEDPRYYTLGRGRFLHRTGYSISRLLITRTDSGGASPNYSEIIGNGAAAGIAGLYYPRRERTWTKTGQRWLTQIALDGASNLIKEYWPYLNSKFFHSKN